MHHGKYEQLIASMRDIRAITCAEAHPCDASSFGGVVEAAQAGIGDPVLLGPQHAACKAGLDLPLIQTVEVPHSHAAAVNPVELVRAELLMNGRLHTDELMYGAAHGVPEGRARECHAPHSGRARPKRIRVHVILPGPLKTRAASGIAEFGEDSGANSAKDPLV